MDSIPRLRMFAGPNGSGKTTVKQGLGRPDSWFGIYINPDDIEKTVRETRQLPLPNFGLSIDETELRNFFSQSVLLRQHDLNHEVDQICISHEEINFGDLEFSAYHASVLADYIRRKAVDERKSFTFESVMSSRDKIDLLSLARKRGFRNYLYYIATEDPEINISRVKYRVATGGHDVPEEKIIARYYRSLRASGQNRYWHGLRILGRFDFSCSRRNRDGFPIAE